MKWLGVWFLLFAGYSFAADVNPLDLSDGIIRTLKQLQVEQCLLTTELEVSKANLLKLEQTTHASARIISDLQASLENSQRTIVQQQTSLTNSARLVKQLSLLCDEQMTLYKQSLTKWKRWTLGCAGLIAAYIIWRIIKKRL
jgi:hypothetical protein